jgi:pimeloyl-ACP methyl ester carboxylesterase
VTLEGSMTVRLWTGLLAVGLASAAAPLPIGGPPSILDLKNLPSIPEQGRQAYSRFLIGNVNRAFAIGSNGAFGSAWSAKTIDLAREEALSSCASKGASDCRIYADNLAINWPGRETNTVSKPPSTLLEGSGYAFIPDERFLWYPPALARGIIVWGHGWGGDDERGTQPPAFLRALNNDGYSVVRFDREPNEDLWMDRQTRHLRDGLITLRVSGWKRIVAGGQSRGGWNALDLLRTPGAADAIITASAGPGSGTDVTRQIVKGQTLLYSLVDDAPSQTTRLAYIQFADDPYGGDKAQRAARVRDILGPKLGALLLIDRPEGFSGHGGAYRPGFAAQYGECIKRFVEDPVPPPNC